MNDIKGFIFDLDGVLVDTAKYHYLAWRRLANELGFDLTLEQNELLKGVSRMASLDIVLGIGGLKAEPAQKEIFAEWKNGWYVELISRMQKDELLTNAEFFVQCARASGLKTAIGSASKNTSTILDRLGIAHLFNAVVDGTKVHRAKPDPEVFLLAASELSLAPEECVVFEDAEAGVSAAKAGGMRCVGIGQPERLRQADLVVSSFVGLMPETICLQLAEIGKLAVR